MIFTRFLKPLQLSFTRSIHIHKELIKGEKPGSIIIAHGMLGEFLNFLKCSCKIFGNVRFDVNHYSSILNRRIVLNKSIVWNFS